jgi:DNA polymerase IV
VHDRTELGAILTLLAAQVAADLQRKAYVGRTIGIKLRFENFRTVTRDLTLAAPTADAAAIRRAAGLCLKRVDLTQRLRLLGVRAATLSRRADLPDATAGVPKKSRAPPRDDEPELFDEPRSI